MIKRLELEGFKSFDKRLSIPLSKGFTAVVGPNGSGKSNISDAICFVLGKTSAKSMRAGKLTQLIFNGGKGKKPAAKTEVSLILDNTAKKLPYDEDEVCISRRLTQKGTMSYRINGKKVTRTEIVDLLSFSDFDPDGHNIILQGDVTNFIDMDPVERRQILDDISGISEYDDKKLKALKDLDVVESRVKELIIVMGERKKHLSSLKTEKEDAETYLELKEELVETEANLLYTKLKNIEKEEARFKEKLGGEEGKLSEAETEFSKASTELESKEAHLSDIDSKLITEGGEDRVNIRTEIEHLNGQISINQNRIESKQSEISHLDGLIAKLQSMSGERTSALCDTLKDEIDGVHGTVGSLFTVDQKYAVAIESALGSRNNFIVVENEDIAISCVKFLKDEKMGRATFLPINKVKGPRPEPRSGNGIVGPARKLVSFDERYSNVFSYVLGNTYIVSGLKEVRGLVGKLRMVSLDGDVAEKSGAITGGFKRRRKTASSEIDEYVKSRDKLLDEIGEIQLQTSENEKELKHKKVQSEQLGQDFEGFQKEREKLQENINGLKLKRDEFSSRRDNIRRSIGDLRIEKARVDAGLTDLQISMQKFEGREMQEIDADKMERSLSAIKRQMEKIEPVNMKAIELYKVSFADFESFNERFTKLQEERNVVLEFIEEIELKKKGVFMEVFDKVSEEFSAIFPRLSVNGEGVLYLENGEDPLSGGLNIKASPAGKKITGLELLSGGEKVVTALAFIFALQRYKPAHFYVLDEVDAALDQNNSMRFINLLTDIMKDSQVLLVSHNNAVIKKADRLFGVSMTDGGTSQLVGMDMSELDEKGGQIN